MLKENQKLLPYYLYKFSFLLQNEKRNLVRFWDFFIVSYHFVNTHGTVERQTRNKRECVVFKQASCILWLYHLTATLTICAYLFCLVVYFGFLHMRKSCELLIILISSQFQYIYIFLYVYILRLSSEGSICYKLNHFVEIVSLTMLIENWIACRNF